MRIIAYIISILCVTLALSACDDKKVKVHKPKYVVCVTAKIRTHENTAVTFAGNLNAVNTTILKFNQSGTLMPIKFKMGSKIKEGKLIASLNDAQYKEKLKALAKKIQEDTELKKAKEKEQRTLKASEVKKEQQENKNQESESESESKRPAALLSQEIYVIQRRIANMQRNHDMLQDKYAGMVILAPYSGYLKTIYPHKTRKVTKSDPIIAFGGKGFATTVLVPESVIPYLEVDSMASASVLALPGVELHARVVHIDNNPTASNSYTVRLALLGSHKHLRSGMTVEVSLKINKPAVLHSVGVERKSYESIFETPSTAMQSDEIGNYVLIVDKHHKIRKLRIRVININDDKLVAYGDIAPNTPVVTNGASQLSEGELVTPTNEGPSWLQS